MSDGGVDFRRCGMFCSSLGFLHRLTCPSNGINGGASSVDAFFPTATFPPPSTLFPEDDSDLTGTVFWDDCLDEGDFLAVFFNGDLEDEG